MNKNYFPRRLVFIGKSGIEAFFYPFFSGIGSPAAAAKVGRKITIRRVRYSQIPVLIF